MIKRVISKFSYLLYRTHLFIDARVKLKPPVNPYIVRYKTGTNLKKIIHFNGNFIVGGSTQLIIDILERTSDLYEHKIVVPEYPEPLPYQPVPIKAFSIDGLSRLYEYLKEEQPDLVHIHYWIRHKDRYDGLAWWYYAVFQICSDLGINIIQNVNVPTAPYPSKTLLHNVFVSSYVKMNFDNFSAPASVIYPGSDFTHFNNNDIAALPAKSIGMVYRLDQDKLNPEAIEVFIQAAKKIPDLKCYIIGGGYYHKYYQERVAREGLTGNFIFTGYVSYSELPQYYKKISIFVAPVHDESFGQVTPFAMSMGLNVAGYNIGALSEILGSEDTLVDYGNIEALSDVIVDLVKDTDRRIKMGKYNQERAHQLFSVETMIAGYKNLYAHLIFKD